MLVNSFLILFGIYSSQFISAAQLQRLSIPVLFAALLGIGYLVSTRFMLLCLPVAWVLLVAQITLTDRLPPELAGQDFFVTGTVCDIPARGDDPTRFLLRLDDSARAGRLPARAYISWYRTRETLRAGDRWQLKVRLKPPRGLSNPGGFEFERWTAGRRIGATGYVRSSPDNAFLGRSKTRCRLARSRQALVDRLETVMEPGSVSAHVLALVVGVRNRLTDSDWARLRKTGTVHLMAISGLHVGLVAGLCYVIGFALARMLRLTGLPAAPLNAALMSAVLGAMTYSAMAGFSVPTVRALISAGTVLVLTRLRRRLPVSTVFAVALIVVLVAQPFAVFGAGFWLSFGAVGLLGIVMIGWSAESASDSTQNISRWRRVFVAQAVLSLGLAPATAVFFGEISIVSPLVNIVLVPLFAVLVIPGALIGCALLFVAPAAGVWVVGAIDLIMSQILNALTIIADQPWAARPVPFISRPIACFWLIAALALVWPRPLPARFLILTAALGLTATLALLPVPRLRVVVLDVGHGLSVLVQTNHSALLYDAGPAFGQGDAGSKIVLPALRRLRVTTLDTLVISHADADHSGGAASVLDAFPRARLIAPAGYRIAGRVADTCRANQTWRADGVEFSILHPGADFAAAGDNDGSCVLRVRWQNLTVLLPGDIEAAGEEALDDGGFLRPVDLIVAPHHGSRTSSGASFTAAVSPRFVVYSAGYRNRWGFPAEEVVRRWSEQGACQVSTAEHGALVFRAARGAGDPVFDNQARNGDGVWALRLARRFRTDRARWWRPADPGPAKSPACRRLHATN